jgi:hypothetical protein
MSTIADRIWREYSSESPHSLDLPQIETICHETILRFAATSGDESRRNQEDQLNDVSEIQDLLFQIGSISISMNVALRARKAIDELSRIDTSWSLAYVIFTERICKCLEYQLEMNEWLSEISKLNLWIRERNLDELEREYLIWRASWLWNSMLGVVGGSFYSELDAGTRSLEVEPDGVPHSFLWFESHLVSTIADDYYKVKDVIRGQLFQADVFLYSTNADDSSTNVKQLYSSSQEMASSLAMEYPGFWAPREEWAYATKRLADKEIVEHEWSNAITLIESILPQLTTWIEEFSQVTTLSLLLLRCKFLRLRSIELAEIDNNRLDEYRRLDAESEDLRRRSSWNPQLDAYCINATFFRSGAELRSGSPRNALRCYIRALSLLTQLERVVPGCAFVQPAILTDLYKHRSIVLRVLLKLRLLSEMKKLNSKAAEIPVGFRI